MSLLTLHEDGQWHLDYELEPVEYWPYTTWVHDVVFEGPRNQFKALEEHFITLFKTSGIPCGYENKCAFGVKDAQGRVWYFSFYDFRFSIGSKVSSPDWKSPKTKTEAPKIGKFNI